MADQEITAWWIAIIAGFVVVLAVAALLSLLVWFVKIIDRRVAEIRETLSTITQNTAATTLIPQTGDAVDEVLAEGLQHHLFLGRVLPSIPTPATTNGGGAS
ncbi:hypothetical protein [Pseudonocardia sp. H11422]|uniref:hypothetical protein n=1 Tax=Pseudonocardia sp. H11422 TaxID=2835866 RepID=UPI001BDBBD25|nr:hypothetical protein [Pseudonocardia sp. H11422]